MSDEPRVGRRRFFREGLRRLVARAAESVESVQEAIERASDRPADRPTTSEMPSNIPGDCFLRPPGALPEPQFRQTCSRCGQCVRVCPVQCIRLDPTAAHGVPYIDADLAACAVCESLACMHACPSGALVPTPLFQIRMGTAVWRETSCIRTHGEECRACAERCPMGTAAIDVVGNRIEINPAGCVGCGVCQQVCPTSPKSIQVIPVAARYQ